MPLNLEMALCLCKLCLNTRLLFDSTMLEEKKSGGEIFKSVTEFFTAKCDCTLSSNGFTTGHVSQKNASNALKWNAFSKLKCKQCSKVITHSQFEQKEIPYSKEDRLGNHSASQYFL